MFDRLAREPVSLEPARRSVVEGADGARLDGLQSVAQRLAKQEVIPVPASVGIQRHEEQIRPFELLQHGLAVLAAGDGVAEVAGEPVEDRGVQQKLLERLRLAMEHLLDHIVEHVAMTAGEASQHGRWIGLAVEGKRCELESGGPTLRRGRERVDQVSREHPPQSFGQECGRLLDVKAEEIGVDLGELTASPQPRQGQRRRSPTQARPGAGPGGACSTR